MTKAKDGIVNIGGICKYCGGPRPEGRKMCDICSKQRRHKQQSDRNRKPYNDFYYYRNRIEALKKIAGENIKCIRCGCTELAYLEINHINGGGCQETMRGSSGSAGRIQLARDIVSGVRKTDDLNILCRPCNNLDYIERLFGRAGMTGFEIIWHKDKAKPVPIEALNNMKTDVNGRIQIIDGGKNYKPSAG